MSPRLTTTAILEAARAELRRHGEARTTMTEVARVLGVSHAALYRHFDSKAALLEALAAEALHDEEMLVATHVAGAGPVGPRIEAMVLDLHRRRLACAATEGALHALFLRVTSERPALLEDYSRRMTALLARLLAQGVEQGELRVEDPEAAAGVLRDALTAFLHPAFAPRLTAEGPAAEARLRAVLAALLRGFAATGG